MLSLSLVIPGMNAIAFIPGMTRELIQPKAITL
jgi:hypothetical protein